jgi:hypothetical protein
MIYLADSLSLSLSVCVCASLAAVNFFLGCVGAVQVSRIFMYRRSLKGTTTTTTEEAATDIAIATEAKDVAEGVASKVESVVKTS